MDEKQNRFLKVYLILVFATFLNYGIKYVGSGDSGDASLDSLITFIIGNLLIIYLYRKANGITNSNAQ